MARSSSLDAKPAPARSSRAFRVAASGAPAVTLRAIEWSSSHPRPIVFLHGGGANAEWWADVAPRFTDLGTPIALDLRGHGDSDAPPEGPYGFSAYGSDVIAVLEALARPAVLVGASMGGLVGMYVAARSQSVERLVVVDSPLQASQGVSERRRRMSTPKRYASREEAISRFRILPSGTRASPATIRRIAEHSFRELPDGTWQLKYDPTMFSGPPRKSAEATAAKIRIPLLYLRGENSELVGEESVSELRALVPDARVVTMPDTGHHLFLDDPEGFVEIVRDFLSPA